MTGIVLPWVHRQVSIFGNDWRRPTQDRTGAKTGVPAVPAAGGECQKQWTGSGIEGRWFIEALCTRCREDVTLKARAKGCQRPVELLLHHLKCNWDACLNDV